MARGAPPATTRCTQHNAIEAAIRGGALVYAAGKLAVGLADTPGRFFGAIWASSLGCVCVPALVAFLANTAAPAERGALLGGLQTLQELTAALGYPFYARSVPFNFLILCLLTAALGYPLLRAASAFFLSLVFVLSCLALGGAAHFDRGDGVTTRRWVGRHNLKGRMV